MVLKVLLHQVVFHHKVFSPFCSSDTDGNVECKFQHIFSCQATSGQFWKFSLISQNQDGVGVSDTMQLSIGAVRPECAFRHPWSWVRFLAIHFLWGPHLTVWFVHWWADTWQWSLGPLEIVPFQCPFSLHGIAPCSLHWLLLPGCGTQWDWSCFRVLRAMPQNCPELQRLHPWALNACPILTMHQQPHCLCPSHVRMWGHILPMVTSNEWSVSTIDGSHCLPVVSFFWAEFSFPPQNANGLSSCTITAPSWRSLASVHMWNGLPEFGQGKIAFSAMTLFVSLNACSCGTSHVNFAPLPTSLVEGARMWLHCFHTSR